MDISVKCRGCLNEENEMHNIFSEFDQGLSLSQILQTTLNMEISEDDSLPPYLCTNCTSVVVDFFNFKSNFLENNDYMKRLVEGLGAVEQVWIDEGEGRVDVVLKTEEDVEESIQLVVEDEGDDTVEEQQAVTLTTEENQSKNEYKPFTCTVCSQCFRRKSDLVDHLAIHSNDKNYICSYCGKAFQRRTVLVKHKRLHTHPRQAICELCGKAFNDKGTLKTHIMLIHVKSRNFHCEQCGLTFPLKATLEKHIRRHNPNREKPFVCQICNMAYNDKYSLNRHISTKHDSNPYVAKCECGEEYDNLADLLNHKNEQHTTLKIEEDDKTNVLEPNKEFIGRIIFKK